MEKEIIIEAVRREIRASRMDLGEPQEFVRLIEVASEALRIAGADPVSTVRLHSLTAMGVHGPKIGLPDDEQCETLEGLVERYCEESDHESLLDLVAAFGCGWHRDPGILDSDWTGLWNTSFIYLVKRVHGICRSVYRSLAEKLRVQFPAEDNPEQLLPQTAAYIAKMLVQPVAPVTTGRSFIVSAGGADGDPIYAGLSVATDVGWEEDIPTGARAVYQCTDGEARDETFDIGFAAGDVIRMVSSETVSNMQVWSKNAQTKKHEKKPTSGSQFEFLGQAELEVHACTCGRDDCGNWHRLSAWDPGEEFGKLQYFLYNAIRGRMQSIKAKDFAQSLLGSYWARHGWGGGPRLRLAEVIHRACLRDECRKQDDDGAVRVHMGDRCDRCGTAADHEAPLVTRERLIVVDTEQLLWEFREYWRCGARDCKVPGLGSEGKTIIDPEISIMRNGSKCASCGEAFWTEDQYAEMGRHFANARTLLAGIRRLEKSRKEQQCDACGHKGEVPKYCFVCELNGRPGELPARPSWYFVSTRPSRTSQETESEEEKMLRQEDEMLGDNEEPR